ncbi:hypothetical protein RB597_003720 [Gaeumannomyces tritici]
MKFLPLPDFVTVTSALNFDTPDCHVSGGCDLYTTKSTGQDKKLYKNIDKSLENQHASLVKFGASLSPPQRAEMSASLNLSRSSPFGSLADISSRRTFAYLIATLNASHPDYDFSHVLRPSDFKREKSLKRVMNNLDSTLGNTRAGVVAGPDFSLSRSCSSDNGAADPVWGPQTWALINKQMMLEDCTVFSYQPAENPFDEEEGAIWTLHYFFFNKALKRVAYLHARGVPVTSHSRRGVLDGAGYSIGARLHGAGAASGAYNDDDSSEEYGPLSASLKRGYSDFAGANKRAKFWFGDRAASRVPADSDDEMDDGMIWNRTADGEFDDGYRNYDDDDDDDDDVRNRDDDDTSEEEGDESDTDLRIPSKGPIRAVSEDIASRMEIE